MIILLFKPFGLFNSLGDPKMTSKELLKKTKEAVFSRAIPVPLIEERRRMAMVARKTAWRADFFLNPMTTTIVAAMIHHCARREARHKTKQKV